MEIFKVIGFAIIAVVIITILKSLKKDDFALIVTVIASALLLGFLLVKLESIIQLLNSLVDKAGINREYLEILLKVTGISYVVELASNICKDSGSTALASKIEVIGKVCIVTLTIPVLTSVISVVLNIL